LHGGEEGLDQAALVIFRQAAQVAPDRRHAPGMAGLPATFDPDPTR
jgi:hypothetical protein